MKKGLKLFLAVLMVVSVCSTFILTASAVDVPNSYLDSSSYAVTDGTLSNATQPIIKDGKMTFKVNMASGLTVTGAMVTVKFDKNVLKVVDAGAVTTEDADGDTVEVVTGMHTHGVPQYDDSAYTFAYISANGFKTGTSGKEYVYITFQVIDKTYPQTTVEFVAGDYTSTDTIKKFQAFETIDAVTPLSFDAGNKAINVKWNAVQGATEYLVYRKGGADTKYRVVASVRDISYYDTEDIQNGTKYTYAVRAKNSSGRYGWYVGASFDYLDTVKLTVTNSTAGVKIAWDKVDGATQYRIYKRVAGETKWTALKTVDSSTLTITDSAITSGVKYEYTARALKGESRSAIADIQTIQHVAMVSKVTLANGSKGVNVKWTAVNGAEKYRIYRKVKGEANWTVLKNVDANVVSLTDTGATSGKTNYYAVRAYANGTWSAYKSYGINYIAAPVVTKAYSTVGTGNTIKWKAVAGTAQYRVYRKTSANGKWSLLGKTTSTSYTDKNVTLGKSYIYTVRAENGKNLSGYNATGWTIKYTLTTPTVSKITTTSNSITVKWGAVKNVDGYRLYRKVEGQSKWSQIAKITGTSYTDKSVKAGTVYTYTVRAYKGSTLSAYNKTGWNGVILKTPTVKIANSEKGVKVTWSKVSGAAGYTVYSSQYNASTKKWSSWKNRGTTKATTLSWVDTKVTSGTYYKYTVRAVNGLCKSSYKASASLLYLAQPTVTISNALDGITVKWTKAGGATGYRIYRAQLDEATGKWSSWKTMGNVKANKASWTDKSVVDGVTYKYTVRTVSGKVLSSYKASGALMFLKTPELLSCKKTTDGYVIEFEQNQNADSYRVYRKTLYTNWTLLETVSGSENTVYTDKDIIEETEYIYTVKAVNGKSASYYDKTGISTANAEVVENTEATE